MHPLISTAGYVSLAALVVWRMRVRWHRLLKRQRLSRYRPPISLAIYGTLAALLAWLALAEPLYLLWYALALAGGAALGVFGLRRTKFEAIAGQGLFYTPHAPLGIALMLMLAARIVWRLAQLIVLAPAGPHNHLEFWRSPITLLSFGLYAGYVLCYMLGLWRWRVAVLRRQRERAAAQAS